MRQGSKMRKLGAFVAMGLVAGVMAEAATAHTVRFGGSLTISFQPVDNVFKGRVASTNDRCERGRTVAVFRVTSGPDQRVASDRTDSDGRWRVTHNARADDYYAKALRKDISPAGHSHVCRAITTSTFKVPPRCGNGWLEEGEACDDGNQTNGDGCNNGCQVEGPLAQLAAKEVDEDLAAACAARRRSAVGFA